MKKKEVRTLEQLVEFINEHDDWSLDVADIIKINRWQDIRGYNNGGVCGDEEGDRLVTIDAKGKAEIRDSNSWFGMDDDKGFSKDQLNLIRDTFAEILWYPEQGNRFVLESDKEALDIINTCQRIDCNPEFESVEQFRKNTAKWTEEPVIPEEEEE